MLLGPSSFTFHNNYHVVVNSFVSCNGNIKQKMPVLMRNRKGGFWYFGFQIIIIFFKKL